MSTTIEDAMNDLANDVLWSEVDPIEGRAAVDEARAIVQTTLSNLAITETEIKLRVRLNEITKEQGYQQARDMLSKRRGATKFFHLVEMRQHKLAQSTVRSITSTIWRHRARTQADGLEPSEFDLQLWSLLKQPKVAA